MGQGNLHRSPMRFGLLAVPLGAVVWWLIGERPTTGELFWLAGMIAMVGIRMPHHSRNQANAVEADAHDLGEKLLLTGMWLASMILPLVAIATPWLDFATYALPSAATPIGAILLVPYLWLFWRSHADLGRNWSPGLEVRAEHELVTNGIYAHIRNPMYAAIWLGAFAQALLVQNWIGGFLVVPAFLAMWVIRVPREEAMMRARFGAAWDAYVARTGRLLPRLKRTAATGA